MKIREFIKNEHEEIVNINDLSNEDKNKYLAIISQNLIEGYLKTQQQCKV